ncbi:UNKNOWN [Stylonychia lemnae]|uniref:Cyclic nucleotide-binding domain-containing protein n=1 Tax=Stylonychia lemnae TaxID=5949 RepID=A0A078A039_STYLE|nr:UNKNOWN [Stylonychia lemnae]|eukprot:CDW75551.1 UNKNOWN [Stylonychia lemnae]
MKSKQSAVKEKYSFSNQATISNNKHRLESQYQDSVYSQEAYSNNMHFLTNQSAGTQQNYLNSNLPMTLEIGSHLDISPIPSMNKNPSSFLPKISSPSKSSFKDLKLLNQLTISLAKDLPKNQRNKREFLASPQMQGSITQRGQIRVAIQNAQSKEREEFKEIISKIDHQKNGELTKDILNKYQNSNLVSDFGNLWVKGRLSLDKLHMKQKQDNRNQDNNTSTNNNTNHNIIQNKSLERVIQEKLLLKQKRVRNSWKTTDLGLRLQTENPTEEQQRLYEEFKEKMRRIAEQKKRDEDDFGESVLDKPQIFLNALSDGQPKSQDENTSDRVELKRYLKQEKEKIFNISKIASKSPDYRNQEEKHYFMMYLKFKVLFFKSIQKEVLNMLTEKFAFKEYKEDEVIMRKGDDGDFMCVIIKGEVGVYIDVEVKNCIVILGENKVFGERALETDDKRRLEYLSSCNKYFYNSFQGNNQWEVCATKKQILYKVKDIKPGDIFGHEEMIQEREQKFSSARDLIQAPVQRNCRVRALALSDLIYFNKNDFFEFFNEVDLKILKQNSQVIDKEDIVNRIRKNNMNKKQINDAILNATQLNYISSEVGGAVKHQRNHMNSRDRKMQKLNPWFQKVKTNKTVSPQVLREDEKIKVLNVTKNKIMVDEKKNYIQDYFSPRDQIASGSGNVSPMKSSEIVKQQL